MRAVNLLTGATRWLCAGALYAGCLHVEDIPLGALEHDAGSENEPPDASSDQLPPPVVSMAPDAAWIDDAYEEEREREEEEARRALARDAGSLADAAAFSDAGAVDASADSAAVDAGRDAAKADAASEEDSGPLDAATDAQRSLLCTLEPWHCL